MPTPVRPAVFLRALALLGLSAAALPAQEKPPGPLVSGDWLQARLGDPRVLVVQVESRRDVYEAGHVPGAVFIPLSAVPLLGGAGIEAPPTADLDAALEAAGVGDDRHVVITTRSPLSATRLWLTLDYLGHGDHASILDGGLARWTAEGRPLANDAPAAARASFTPRPRPESIVDAGWIAARLDDPAITLLDARTDAEYAGTEGGMGGQLHAGHIPGAEPLYWEALIRSRESDPSFLPLDRLRARFEAAGAGPGRTLVAYCVIGTRASLLYFAGRMLGYDIRLYEGSWNDWGGRDLPYVSGPNRR